MNLNELINEWFKFILLCKELNHCHPAKKKLLNWLQFNNTTRGQLFPTSPQEICSDTKIPSLWILKVKEDRRTWEMEL